MVDISKFRQKFLEDKVEKSILERNFLLAKENLVDLEEKELRAKEARTYIQEVAKSTQKNVEIHFSSLVTMALKSINKDFPEFVTTFEIKRNHLNCILMFKDSISGELYEPMEDSGFGAVDVGAFGTKISVWSIDKKSYVMIMDEPFRNVSPDLQGKVSQLLKYLSQELGLQFIIVSHAENVNYSADRTFKFSKANGITEMEVFH